jgi:hypothetical protein
LHFPHLIFPPFIGASFAWLLVFCLLTFFKHSYHLKNNQMKNLIVLTALIMSICSTAFSQTKADKKDTLQHSAFYTCPMHPDVTANKSGKCPKCGMDLVLSKKEELKKEVTKTYHCPVHVDVVSNHSGKCSKCNSKLVTDRKGSKQARVVYTCGMHPDVESDKAGKCSVCGMELTKKKIKAKG